MPRQIIFVHPRVQYDSYTDYRSLVDVSLFETCFIDEMRLDQSVVYIVCPINGEYRPHIDNHRNLCERKCKIVMWQLERPGGDREHEASSTLKAFIESNIRFIVDGYADQIWISDRWLSGLHTDHRVVFAPMGSDTLLYKAPKAWEIEYKNYTYMHLCYISYRRQILDALRSTMKYSGLGWGEVRTIALQNTKFLVNVHQDVHLACEPLRIALAAASGIPYISEKLNDPFPMIPGVHFCQCLYKDLLDTVRSADKESYCKYSAMGVALHDLLCGEYRFEKGVIDRCKVLTSNFD